MVDTANTTSPPTVSVIIPAFDAADEIEATLVSVLGQTYTDFEILLVNDGSRDTQRLEQVIAPYRSRLHYQVQPNLGAGAARNAALRVASGRYVAFLDADDRWHPHFLNEQLRVLERDPTCAMVYSDCRIAGDSPLTGRRFSDHAPSCPVATPRTLLCQMSNIPLSTVVARRDVIDRLGGFEVRLLRGQDFDLWLRVALDGQRIVHNPAVLAERHVRRRGLSGNRTSELRRATAVYAWVLQHCALSPDLRAEARRRLAAFEDSLMVEQAKAHLRRADVAGALEWLAATRRPSLKTRVAWAALRCAPDTTRRLLQAAWSREPVWAEPDSGDPPVLSGPTA